VVGDRYLICSDGLSNPVSDESIAATLRDFKDPEQCAERLVQLALRGGGPDNVTVIVLDVTDEDILEGKPYVGGAASRDRGLNGRVNESTPAARASALTTPRPAVAEDEDAEEEEQPDPKRHPGRTALLLILVLAVLVGGGWYGWGYTQSRYYVGATNDGHVAVFQGVQGKIVGLKLNHYVTGSDLTLDDLNAITQTRVKQGIPASSKNDAESTLTNLSNPSNGFLRQTCPPALSPSATVTTEAPSPSAPATSTGPKSATAASTPKRPSAKASASGKTTPIKAAPPSVAPSAPAVIGSVPASVVPSSSASDNC
jgi:protein phosphatase